MTRPAKDGRTAGPWRVEDRNEPGLDSGWTVTRWSKDLPDSEFPACTWARFGNKQDAEACAEYMNSLRADNARLREALETMLEVYCWRADQKTIEGGQAERAAAVRKARAALAGDGGKR